VNLVDSQVVEWNIQMAGALIAALPTVIVYIFLGKYFLRGLLRVLLKDNYYLSIYLLILSYIIL
jgi:glucose/mannose transport system permease protein